MTEGSIRDVPIFELNYEIVGLDGLAAALERMPEALGSEVEQAIDRALMLAQGKLAIYPPAIPGSHYRRTGLLGQLWAGATHRVRRVMGGAGRMYIEGSIQNARPGIERVQHEPEQIPVHAGRWRTVQQILEELQPEVDRLLQQAGQTVVNEAAASTRR
ncbi:MAG TPA: hypothetical protein VMY40_02065 [Anaerolineae bacterium]|nr:hypothetical protein [Anaerolineae bacterium]